MPRSYMPDTSLLLFAGTYTRKLSPFRCGHPFAGGKVQKVLPVSRHNALLKLAALVGQVWVLSAQRKLGQLILSVEQATRHQIEQAVRVAGHKVHRSLP